MSVRVEPAGNDVTQLDGHLMEPTFEFTEPLPITATDTE